VRQISSAGAYAPRLRIDAEEFREAWGRFGGAGVRTKAVQDADEDALTMGAEAGRRALDAGGFEGDDVDWLAFATTTPPLEEEDLTVRLGSVLGVPRTATTRTVTGSTRSGVRALADALTAGGTDGVALVVAADCPRGAPDGDEEHAAGAGAAAFAVGDSGAEVVDTATYSEPYPGTRFRSAGDDEVQGLGVTQYDREAYRATLVGAIDALDADLGAVDAAALQAPDGKLPYRVAADLGVSTEQVRAATTVHELGDTGAASAPLGLVSALADGAERVLVAGFGSGASATAMVVENESSVPVGTSLDGDVSLTYADYLRRRGEITSGPPAGGGAYVSVPSWTRSVPQRHRLAAGQCLVCGSLQFPPEGACRDCASLSGFDRVVLATTGTVEAVTTIAAGGAPPEFGEQVAQSGPFASAVVSFGGPDGGAVSVPVQVVLAGDDAVSTGDRVRAVVRRIYTQEDVSRYGVKVVPATG